MSIKMVMFDMAGTTVLDNDDVNICFQDAMASTGLHITRDDINAVMGLRKPDAIRLILQEKLGKDAVITDEHVDTLHTVFLRRMLDFYAKNEGVAEIEGTSDVFRQLKAAGIIVAIDSGFSRDIIDTIIERLGWLKDGLIDISVASDEVANARPHPDMILRAMQQFGISDVKEVAKVGDTPADLGEGYNTGCSVNIGVLSGACTREELEAHNYTHIVQSIKDVPAIVISKTVSVGN